MFVVKKLYACFFYFIVDLYFIIFVITFFILKIIFVYIHLKNETKLCKYYLVDFNFS
jgi:hypothetical protein